MIFGEHKIPFSYRDDKISISASESGGLISYSRECRGERFKIKLSAEINSILVLPVEPVNLPKKITNHLEIDFSEPVIIEPTGFARVFVKFPVEICVFVSKGGKINPLDIFTKTKPKYTLYGTPRRGIICRQHESKIYTEIPETDPSEEGVIELSIKNTLSEWVKVSKTVFDAIDMKIFYNNKLISMKGEVKITGKSIAETKFINKPLEDSQKRSVELYSAKGLQIIEKGGFVMEYGYG